MPRVTFLQDACEIELPIGSSLTSIEDEPGGDGLIPFGCRSGSCGACVIEVLSGIEMLDPSDEAELEFLEDLGYSSTSHRLACLCTVRGDMRLSVVSSGD
jgi:ferredoxin